MSSGADTQDDLRNSPQSAREDLGPEDLHVTQSSILYLLQEATKLASPANQHSPGAKGIHDNAKAGSSCSSTPLSQKSQKVSSSKPQPSLTGVLSMLSSVQASSPWEVMSLINLQCERLLHSGQSHEEDDACTRTTKTDSLALITGNAESGCVNAMECSSLPSAVLFDTSTPNVSLRRDSAEHDRETNVWFSMTHIIDGTDQLLVNQTQENISTKHKAIDDLAELIAENTGSTFPSSSASIVSEESIENCFHIETSMLQLAKKVNPCDPPSTQSSFHIVEEQGKMDSTLSSGPEIRAIDFTSSLVVEKDGDSNMCTSNAYESPQSEITVVSKDAPQTSLAVSPSSYRTDLNNNQEDNKDEKPQEPGEAKAVSSTQPRWGNHRRTPRKQAHPARSPDLQDPELQGVTFSMHTELDHNTDQCRLLITSNYRQVTLFPLHGVDQFWMKFFPLNAICQAWQEEQRQQVQVDAELAAHKQL
ncbi:hypothetical protein P4O66_000599 [Electrophorus voltai]|uniref:Uncharacterized protein n=1 Tax=Electrophorus voltai TaxID=2609070 RepID=A0AAD9DWK1_9TELE|nr:hypothetical protein P4O66_000599 [Electrophorus voltai]